MAERAEAGIAAFERADGSIVGMGIVLDSRHILTCAHVVNAALEREFRRQDQPDTDVQIAFPFVQATEALKGKVVKWHAMSLSGKPFDKSVSDIAVVELKEEVPGSV